ncbi:uncharacterized protein L969DRAFT_93724 [Mixia osmundae IAM 14324]|uniref:RRM domain-containing protein n=1 Tax=Mixia osmundae (strain CBS 9802 / IAM 14324 / JCM 22182 / KY 12970) TaxID=764103 RepID=G7E9E3_MIXOS|nr:uncharacterized protein L969DRAFT_93724 [Mixia osmundae IAM 14324]KEI39892.1 hypothetical protein L969DRAFT_93724 [Mixia osmundae IAM 14324]GAA99262.1 hypothetical protein E5Q_05956 [Mixia osmundae IAM 14324]
MDRSRSRSMSRSPSPRRPSGGKRAPSLSPRSSRSRSPTPVAQSRGHLLDRTVTLSKLTPNVTEAHLREIFGVYGKILSIDFAIPRGGRPRGEADIVYDHMSEADKAIAYMDQGQLDGVTIRTEEKRTPSPEPARPPPYRSERGGYRGAFGRDGPPPRRGAFGARGNGYDRGHSNGYSSRGRGGRPSGGYDRRSRSPDPRRSRSRSPLPRHRARSRSFDSRSPPPRDRSISPPPRRAPVARRPSPRYDGGRSP